MPIVEASNVDIFKSNLVIDHEAICTRLLVDDRCAFRRNNDIKEAILVTELLNAESLVYLQQILFRVILLCVVFLSRKNRPTNVGGCKLLRF